MPCGIWYGCIVGVVLLLHPLLPTSERARAGNRGVVHGHVYDSLSGRPLAGALVQLTAKDIPLAFSRSIETDANGAFTFGAVPSGRYIIGFLHPVLDSVGVSAPVRNLDIAAGESHHILLAVPSASTVVVAVCGAETESDSLALLVGYVRDPRDNMPIGGARVTASWMEVTYSSAGIARRTPSVSTITGRDGWFALCNLPRVSVNVSVTWEAESLGLLDLRMPPDGLLRRNLYIHQPTTALLRGEVLRTEGGRPIIGAVVVLDGAAPARTDDQGQWAVAAPLGTRMLLVRALGYVPERRIVDVTAWTEPQELTLTKAELLLDTVKVIGTPFDEVDEGSFQRRRRGSGFGRYLSSDEIARRNPIFTTDIFRSMPGFVDGIAMRSPFSGVGGYAVTCRPAIYVDGHHVPDADINALMWPEHIAAVEVYYAGSAKPPQFEPGLSGCGSIVIWLKPLRERLRRGEPD